MAGSSQSNEQGPDWRKTWPRDLLASLVVFLVALPLCMGIALASGAPVAAGLTTGIIGGLIVGLFAGSPLQVSGPAAGLTVICGEVIREHGLPALGVIVIIAGGLQFAAGIFKLGQWFRAVSPAVIHGMLSGIGVLLLSSQIHVMVDDRPRHSGLANIASIPEALWKGLPLPAWEPAELRRDRIRWLQDFGQLHERQREIEDHVSRTITRHATAYQHAREAEGLAAFVSLQEKLVADVSAARTALADSPSGLAGGERDTRTVAAVHKARLVVDAALLDLQEKNVDHVVQSLGQASNALADVLRSLKSHDWAAKVGLLSIAVIMLWQGLAPKFLKLIPGPLLAVVGTTAVAWALSLPVLYVEVPDNLIDGLTFPSANVFQDVPLRELIVGGIMMAVIASAETLLCAAAVDRMHQGPRTNYDRELAAQGIGNLLCGCLGALPMTGVIVRSAANVQAGAKSRLSAILHGVLLLVFVVALSFVLRMIPTAALAGILVYTGFKLIDFKIFKYLWHVSRTEALIFLITVIVIVAEDLLTGVITGVVLSAVKLLVTFAHLDIRVAPATGHAGQKRVTLSMNGAATFLRLPLLAARLEEVPPGTHLHVDLGNLNYIDHACLEMLTSWAKQHEATGGKLSVDWGVLHARFKSPAHNGAPASGQPADEKQVT